MTPKRKVSQREVWLLALLPAALVAIVSFALPGPADEVSALELRLERASTSEAQAQSRLREYAQQLQESRKELAALEAQEAQLNAEVRRLNRPSTQRRARLDVAAMLDEFARRLSGHGAQVLAMEIGKARPGVKRAANVPGQPSGREPQEWVVSVAGTWSTLRAAMADEDAFPKGLGLSAIKMDPVRSNGALRRWELIVTVAEHSP
ncbi:MAG: hypothetical protein AAGI68_00190 [Planctomycetota bacterium]